MDTTQNHWKLFLVEGILFIILGLLAIALPVFSTLSITVLVGWLFLLGGIIQAGRIFLAPGARGYGMTLVNSVIAIIVGVLMLVFPLTGMLTLTVLLAFYFLVEGIAKIALSMQWRPVQNWGWVMLSGFLAIILSAIIFSGLPGTASWALGLLVGINMLFFGWTMIFLAISIRPAT